MADSWYEAVLAASPIMQGDFILGCPLSVWSAETPRLEGGLDAQTLDAMHKFVRDDVVVMTQSCDLEQRKVSNVVVCSLHGLKTVREKWTRDQQAKGQKTNEDAWRTFFGRVRNGFIWNYTVLNRGEARGLKTDHCIVDFHDVFTIPLSFLETYAAANGPRLRLRSPYAEHLSQSFARYFMRVGLPTAVDDPWK